MEWFVIIGYTLALFSICLFSLGQLHLAWHYRKARKNPRQFPPLSEYPLVTVQLPVYNERYVVERLIDAVCALDYPADRLEIQVLDDSTDDTSTLIDRKVQHWLAQGKNIHHVTRANRTGYKAGALQYGLQIASGDYIAIFDADFLPDSQFLQKTLPAFSHSKIGMVQTRWGHLNQDFNLLTRLQAFGLNAHFTVEQAGRRAAGRFMNFNGTAGIWRKACIEDAGGWQHDTLTEDLDLSYRAQLRGWEFEYLEDVLSPAELPVLVPAIKGQQYRWNKGAAETARKNLGNVLRAPLSLGVKLHATLHLLNSSVFILLMVAALLSIPMLYIKAQHVEIAWLFNLASIFLVGFVAMAAFYWVSLQATTKAPRFWHFVRHFPLFLLFSMGLALHNAMAVLEGYFGKKTPFIRTPKFNILTKTDSWKGNTYLKNSLEPITFLEGLLALYFLFGIGLGIWLSDFGLILFHLMLTVGFGVVFVLSLKHGRHAGA